MMVRYSNGAIPPGVLTTIATGIDTNGYWEFQITPATLTRWNTAKAYALAHFGRTMHIRTGWNVYRPLAIQRAARARECARGNCNGAAMEGYSSHGGNWGGRDCLAIDVDPNGLSWPQVWEACRAAGFECGLITERISGIPGGEPWHIIDFHAFDPAPAGTGSVDPFTTTTEEDDMLALKITNGSKTYLATLGVGVFRHLIAADNPERVKNIVRSADDWQTVTLQELPTYLRTYGCDLNIWDISGGDFAVLDPMDATVKAGGMWSAANAARAAISRQASA